MPYTFADLHCHPTMYPFNRMRNRPNMEADPDMFHPWRMLPSNLRHMERGHRAASYTQSSFAQLTRGNVRLVFAALSPIERGFFGVGPGQQVPDQLWPRILLQQLFGLVDVIFQDDRLSVAAKRTIWDRLCIGTDFDGVMHPVPIYPTVLEFERFAGHLHDALHQYRHTRMIDKIGIDEIVEKLAWRNAYEFTMRHFPGR